MAEFIDGIVADDDAEFANQSYRKVYNAYFELYDEGLSQLQIQTRLMNSTDQEIAAVAKELLIEKYQITVKNYEQSLTATSTILVQFVPKTLLVYQCKKVELLMKQLTKELAGETGVPFLPSDFKKRDGYKKSIELSREYCLYRQNYCGCEFSSRPEESDAETQVMSAVVSKSIAEGTGQGKAGFHEI